MRFVFLIIVCVLICGCASSKLPDTKYNQFNFSAFLGYEGEELFITIENPIHSPLRVWIHSAIEELDEQFQKDNPITVAALSDTTLQIPTEEREQYQLSFTSKFGDLSKETSTPLLSLPFPAGRKYKIIQGYNSTPSHNKSISRYAIDFSLQKNDTICAATGGYVVGVIEEYKDGGSTEKWRPYGNFVTIFEPKSGIYTQYAHQVHNGIFVEVGDTITEGQPLGLAGMTGWTTVQHLHFNCFVPSEDKNGFKSIPVQFKEGYRGEDMKRGMFVKK